MLLIPMPRVQHLDVGGLHPGARVDLPRRDPGAVQRRPETIPGSREVGVHGRRPQPGVDADEEQPHVVPGEVVDGRTVVSEQLSMGESTGGGRHRHSLADLSAGRRPPVGHVPARHDTRHPRTELCCDWVTTVAHEPTPPLIRRAPSPLGPPRRPLAVGDHLSEAASRRRRRRTLQRCSAVVATLFLGTSQCDAPETASSIASQATAPAATTAVAAPATTAGPDARSHRRPHGDHRARAPATAPTSTAPARVVIPGPDGTEVAGRCTQYEDLLMIHAPAIGWDVLRMSRLAWRESNCWAEIRSRTSDSGLLQINDITLSFLNEALGEPVDAFTLMDPVQNVRAAAALCTFWARNGSSCYQPWSTS